MIQHDMPDDPFTASIVATLSQLTPSQQASVVSVFFASAAPYLSQPAQVTIKPQNTVKADPDIVQGAPDQAEAEEAPLGDVDQAILDLLYRMDAPMMGPDIAEAVGNSLSYVKERLTPAAPLRARGLIANKPRVGYFITDAGRSLLSSS